MFGEQGGKRSKRREGRDGKAEVEEVEQTLAGVVCNKPEGSTAAGGEQRSGDDKMNLAASMSVPS